MNIGTSTATVITLGDGRHVDLLEPQSSDIVFATVAHHLAQVNRYGGAAKMPFTVAQHLVHGTDAILKSTDDIHLARYFLCHDMHEFAIGDAITPLKRALGALGVDNAAAQSISLESLYAMLAYRWDVAIHRAAGLEFPVPHAIHRQVERWDLIMLRTEWRDLMPVTAPFEWPEGIDPLPDIIDPMSWQDARTALHARCLMLLPSLQSMGAAQADCDTVCGGGRAA